MNKHTQRIAIISNEQGARHSGSWTTAWKEYCNENGLDHQVFPGYSLNLIDEIRNYDILLWHFSGYRFQDMLMARSVIYSAKAMGLKVFPDFEDAWHFDDKLAENYLLQAVEAPLPNFYHFFSFKTLQDWLNDHQQFPIVAKLKNGSGSHNVKLIKNKSEALAYGKRMFGKGFSSTPSLLFKASSNIKSSRSVRTFINRAKRIPEFLRTLNGAKEFPNEKGYVFFQEFIPNDGYDIKIVVVGDKLSFIVRNIRKGDFRASGGGDLFFDRKYVTQDIIASAFAASDALNFKCMGYDYVVNNETGEPKIVEISYGFSHTALLQAGGYFDREGNWHEEPLNAPYEVLNNLLKDEA